MPAPSGTYAGFPLHLNDAIVPSFLDDLTEQASERRVAGRLVDRI
jgi:hypothetical protein